MARVDSLSDGAKALLQTGSVAGREFSHDLIKKVSGLPDEALRSHLSALTDAELLYERGICPQSIYVFKHALTRDVAYRSLLQKKRYAIHQDVGNVLEQIYRERLPAFSNRVTGKISANRDMIEGERKHVTVLFCDMEDFTPLV